MSEQIQTLGGRYGRGRDTKSVTWSPTFDRLLIEADHSMEFDGAEARDLYQFLHSLFGGRKS